MKTRINPDERGRWETRTSAAKKTRTDGWGTLVPHPSGFFHPPFPSGGDGDHDEGLLPWILGNVHLRHAPGCTVPRRCSCGLSAAWERHMEDRR